jgi:hypothetical protein
MSLFSDPDTLCEREGNRCKKRIKCKRYMEDRDRDVNWVPRKWVAFYFEEFGQFCNHFVSLPKEEVIVKASSETEDAKRS